MISTLQPSRPKPPQQPSQPTYAHQQTRPTYPTPHAPPHFNPLSRPQHQINLRPRTQIEAMPPFPPSSHTFSPPPAFYDCATRHPVFFTSQLRKPPFPIPTAAAHGWSPVATGYILEQKKMEGKDEPRTKL